MRKNMHGVTLLELMVVVVIVALLASVAIPSYRSYVVRTQRSDATAALLRLAAAQEKFYLQNNTYTTDEARVGGALSEHGWYAIEITEADAETFTARATPVEGGPQARDAHCAFFEINESGEKDATNADCWQ